jgi:hypothetical protein
VEPTKELVDAIYRERIRRAREAPVDQKFLAGAELFERSCRIMMDGIRDEYGDIDEQQVRAILEKRLDLLRRLRRPQ